MMVVLPKTEIRVSDTWFVTNFHYFVDSNDYHVTFCLKMSQFFLLSKLFLVIYKNNCSIFYKKDLFANNQIYCTFFFKNRNNIYNCNYMYRVFHMDMVDFAVCSLLQFSSLNEKLFFMAPSTVWSEGFLYKVAPLELKISPSMYFSMYNSMV